MGKCNSVVNACNSNYLFKEVALGGGVPELPQCTVFCLIDTYSGGEFVTHFWINSTQVSIGGWIYTDNVNIAFFLDIALQASGCIGNLSGYSVGGLTGVEATYAWANVDLGCVANIQEGDIDGTFIAMECDAVTVAANFNVGGGGGAGATQIESMTVNGFRYNFSTSFFNTGAVIEAEILAELKTIWGLTVTSVSVIQLGGGAIRITVQSNGTVESLTWDGQTSGSSNFV